MKLSLRDLFWLILTLGIGLAWYVYASETEEVTVRTGEMIAVISIVEDFPEIDSTSTGIVSAVTRDRLQVDSSLGSGFPSCIAFNESGQCLGLTYTQNGQSYVRRLHTFPLAEIKQRLQEAKQSCGSSDRSFCVGSNSWSHACTSAPSFATAVA